jgi:hypothetical protein
MGDKKQLFGTPFFSLCRPGKVQNGQSVYTTHSSLLHFSSDTYILKKLYTLKATLKTLLPQPLEWPLPLVLGLISNKLY